MNGNIVAGATQRDTGVATPVRGAPRPQMPGLHAPGLPAPRAHALAPPTPRPHAGRLEAALRDVVASTAPEDEAACLESVRALEELKAAASAAQARSTARLAALRAAAEAERGVPSRERCRGLGAEVALARRESPHRGGRHLGLARALTSEMPHTLAALTAGLISEEHAVVMVRETAWLEQAHRREVDELMAPRVGEIGIRRLAGEARAHALRLDQAAAVIRRERSVAQRRVSVRPVPAADGGAMAQLTALLPLEQAVAAYAGLMRDAATIVGAGDHAHAAVSPTGRPRTRDQAAADLLVERLTGQATAAAVPIELHLVMTDHSLLGNDGLPAWLPGHGPVSARVARRIVAGEWATRTDASSRSAIAQAAADARLTLRRLYTEPGTDRLVSMESRARIFPPLLRRMVVLRDDRCRTPYCDAPIRHLDHARPHHAGGATHWDNASGLCARCNHVKELPGWRHASDPGVLEVFSPTGQSARTVTPPLLPGRAPLLSGGALPLRGGLLEGGGPLRAGSARRRRERRRRLRRARLRVRAAGSSEGPTETRRRPSAALAAGSETMAE